MAVYATVADLHDYWPDMPAGSDAHASSLLGFAVTIIRAEAGDVSGVDPDVLKLGSLEMVQSAMSGQSAASQYGGEVSSANMSAGIFSQQLSFREASKDLYLTAKHKRWLGVGRQRAFSVDLIGGL